MAAPVASFRSVRSFDDLLNEYKSEQMDTTNHGEEIIHSSIVTPLFSQKDEGRESKAPSLSGRVSPPKQEISQALDSIVDRNAIDFKKIALIALAAIGSVALLAGTVVLAIYAYPYIADIVLSMV